MVKKTNGLEIEEDLDFQQREGIGGLEMHYPTGVSDDAYQDLRQLADDLGMQIVQFQRRMSGG